MTQLIIDTSKMSQSGREFVELALFIVDYKDLQAHNKNLAKHIPGGRYAQCPVKEIEQEIGHRTSQLPLAAQRALTSLWTDKEKCGIPNFQYWYIKHTFKSPEDKAALAKLWHKICIEPDEHKLKFWGRKPDELAYFGSRWALGTRKGHDLDEFRVYVLRGDYKHGPFKDWMGG